MKRLFYQTKLYDYSSMEECTNHILEMRKRGWITKAQKIDDTGCVWYIYENGQTEYPYTVEYYKEM